MSEIMLFSTIAFLILTNVIFFMRTQKQKKYIDTMETSLFTFNELFHALPVPSFYQKKGESYRVNKNFTHAFGNSSTDVLEKIKTLPKNGEQTLELTFDNNIKKNVTIHTSAILNRDKDIIGLAGVLFDISGMQKSKELLLTQKQRLELALDKDRDTTYYKTSLNSALTQANHLIQITQTLLKLSREENLEEAPDEEIMDLQILFKKILDQTSYLSSQKNIMVKNNLSENLPLVISNENLLHTLFFNLIENAIKYSPENTTVLIQNISSGQNLEKLSILISDQGPGIPDSEKSKIFLRFYRIDKSRSKSTGGTGLGLSLVSKICKILRLSIEVKDNHPKGTIIEVQFAEKMIVG